MRDFLEAVWGPYHGYGEIRAIKLDKPVRQAFFDTLDKLRESDLHMLDETGWDVYYGVLPRLRPSGRSEDCAVSTRVLWADVDAKGRSKSIALADIVDFPVSPSIIVDSGNGYHAYWLLGEDMPLSIAQRVMRGIADSIGGDRVHDAARILRVPGTHNHKPQMFGSVEVRIDPIPVRLVRFDPTYLHRVADFDDWSRDADRVGGRRYAMEGAADLGRVPDRLRALIERAEPKGARSTRDFIVALGLAECGWDIAAIRQAFIEHPEGCGQKYYEEGRNGDHYLDITIQHALEAAA